MKKKKKKKKKSPPVGGGRRKIPFRASKPPGMSFGSADCSSRICGLKEKSCDPEIVLIIVS